MSYDEEECIDNSEKPSLVLLRPKEGDSLWTLARDNCSRPELILTVNGIDSLDEALGRLIIIPKTG